LLFQLFVKLVNASVSVNEVVNYGFGFLVQRQIGQIHFSQYFPHFLSRIILTRQVDFKIVIRQANVLNDSKARRIADQ
jgi:hypothetical protein